MQCDLSAGRLPRRDFLKIVGAGAAALALPGPVLAEILGASAAALPNFKNLAQTHDLPSLPDWGPYSKKYFGISHIPDIRRGLCFDCSIFPLLAQGPAKLPSVMDQSGVHPWEASPDVNFYSLRTELIWKDQLYCDLSFFRSPDMGWLVRIELVNQTADAHDITLNCLTQLVFPPVKELTSEPIRLCAVKLPPAGIWIHALDYTELRFATPRPTDNLVTDGKWRGEERSHDSVGGSVLAENFGKDAGDTAVYRIHLKNALSDAALVLRFQMNEGDRVDFRLDGAVRMEITFRGTGKFETLMVPLGKLNADDCELRFSSLGGAAIAVNGFALVESVHADEVQFVDAPWHPVPEVESVAHGLMLKYEDAPDYYGFTLGMPLAGNRNLKWRDLDAALGGEPGPNTKARIFGDRRRGRAGDPDALFIHAFAAPFALAANSRRVVYGLVCAGTGEEIRRALINFDPASAGNEKIYLSAKEKAFR
ncbi:MAG TPA: twin-arginine translocation signal domain-containing protein, partial [Verrucomicrobiae bacterium]|nr:twin-arginine translocation signal domain-containing protein [Verrucomicrobiae bacterium]